MLAKSHSEMRYASLRMLCPFDLLIYLFWFSSGFQFT